MPQTDDFKDIRPFTDAEARKVFPVITSSPYLMKIMEYVYPGISAKEIENLVCSCSTVDEFIKKVTYPAVTKVLAQTTDGITSSGFDKLEKGGAYLFLSNHRDIVLDSVILNLKLLENGMPFSQSAVGDNLVPDEGLKALASLSKNFVVYRGLPARQTLENSRRLSAYIRHVMDSEKESIWLAQREGRAKDGNDNTQSGVIKMLCMAAGNGESVVDCLKKLRIVPMAISYEYDPNDSYKLRGLMAGEKHQKYVKCKGEDLASILTGITGWKGQVNISAGSVLDSELDALRSLGNPVKQIRAVCSILDNAIHSLYKPFKTNYMACDILSGGKKYSNAGYYDTARMASFTARVMSRIGEIGLAADDVPLAKEKMYSMYAAPVLNKEKKQPDGRQA